MFVIKSDFLFHDVNMTILFGRVYYVRDLFKSLSIQFTFRMELQGGQFAELHLFQMIDKGFFLQSHGLKAFL